jgi:hypothetical protein
MMEACLDEASTHTRMEEPQTAARTPRRIVPLHVERNFLTMSDSYYVRCFKNLT